MRTENFGSSQRKSVRSTLLSRAGKKGGTQPVKFKVCPNRKLYKYHTILTMGSLKEKPRRGKQGNKFED